MSEVELLTRPRLETAADVAALTSTLVGLAFQLENTTHQAQRNPAALSMSGLGGCTRFAAYAVAGLPPSDAVGPEEARQAMLGVWIHEHLLPWLARLLGPDAVYEDPVLLRASGLSIPGTLDLAIPGVVWDIKTVKEWRLDGVRRDGPYSEHRVQVLGYALARHQAGHEVRWVVWLYIDRSTGEVHVEVEEFTNAAALSVVDRVEQIAYHAQVPEAAPREARGPGLSMCCDRCPWLRRCWGDEAIPGQPGAQRSQAATTAGIIQALELYLNGRDMARDGRRDKEFAKLVAAEIPDGRYGNMIFRRGKPGVQPDYEQIAADYATWGKPVPKRPTAGRMIVKMSAGEG